MGKKRNRNSNTEVQVTHNPRDVAAMGTRRRKTWSRHDLRSISAASEGQRQFLRGWFEGQHVCAYGSAGTGKTLMAAYCALSSLFAEDENIDKIIIVRSAVATRNVGFLPGTLEEKQSVYEQAYRDIFSFLIGRYATFDDMKEAGKVEFMLTSHVRGLTWANAAVIVDEAQNMNWDELNSVVTRLGTDSRLILIGDLKQTDLLKHSGDREGFSKAIQVSKNITGIECVEFLPQDIVRSGFVRQWIMATES